MGRGGACEAGQLFGIEETPIVDSLGTEGEDGSFHGSGFTRLCRVLRMHRCGVSGPGPQGPLRPRQVQKHNRIAEELFVLLPGTTDAGS